VAEWLKDYDRYGHNKCSLNSTDCYDLLDSEARDYLRSMGIFTDGYPDVIQSLNIKRQNIYDHNKFPLDLLNKYSLLAPVGSNCLSIND